MLDFFPDALASPTFLATSAMMTPTVHTANPAARQNAETNALILKLYAMRSKSYPSELILLSFKFILRG